MRLEVDGSGLARPRAGIGVYTRALLRAMAAQRAGVSIILHLPAGTAGLATPGITETFIPGPRLIGRHLRWPRRLSSARGDVYLSPAGFLPLGSLRIRSVITVHDLAIYRNPAWFPPRQPLSTRLVVPRSLRNATAIIVPSHNTARDAMELFGVDQARIRVIPHASSEEFRPGPPDEALRARLDLPDRFILFVGTIEPRKNVATLIEAVRGWPDAPLLVVAGSWGWRCEAEHRLVDAAAGRVRVLGEMGLAELAGLYRLASVLAHPAWYEGFGLTLLEAMACGTPVVASAAASIPEVVGDAAITLDPADVTAWREALRSVIEDSTVAERLRDAGSKRAAQFTWGRAAQQTWSVIDGVAAAGTPAK